MKLHRDSGPYKIFRYLALGSGALFVSLTAPASAAHIIQGLIGEYFKKKKFERKRFLHDLRNLQTKDLIDFRELSDGSVKITLTPKGKGFKDRAVLQYKLDAMKLNTGRWDGKWRLVIFDIPNIHKKGRDALARKFRELGMYPLQKSVYVTPYPCESEVNFVASIYEVQKYILVMYVSGFEGQEKLADHFRVA